VTQKDKVFVALLAEFKAGQSILDEARVMYCLSPTHGAGSVCQPPPTSAVSGSSSVYSVVGFLPFLRSRATIVIIHVRRVCLAHLKLHGQGDRGGMGVGAAVMRMST
jgi:hypothetical protein